MAPVHKELPNTHVPHEASVVHTIVHEDKYGIALSHGQELLLTLDDLLERISVIVSIDEQVRDKLLVVPVSFFCS